jgi:CheY-like chemotaxis protein
MDGLRMAYILMIDDSELTLEFTRMMLESDGHQVVITTDPDEFMQLAESDQPRPDLLIVDAIMPVVSGPELILQIRAHHDAVLAAIPILLSSALENQAPPTEGVLLLPKPFTPEELQQALNLALG